MAPLTLAELRQIASKVTPNSPRQEPQQVERGMIGPVHVLDDEHARSRRASELLERRSEHALDGRSRAQQFAPERWSDIEQWTEPDGSQAMGVSWPVVAWTER